MHLIWKRPDGYHGAQPSDFSVLELDGHSRLWLHKEDRDHYPLQISGGWAERESSIRLNNLINLIPFGRDAWVEYLGRQYDHSMTEDPADFYEEIYTWLEGLVTHVKGDTWETEILKQALTVAKTRLADVKKDFISATKKG